MGLLELLNPKQMKCIVTDAGPDFDSGIPAMIRRYIKENPKATHPAVRSIYCPAVASEALPRYKEKRKKRIVRSPREIRDGKLLCSTCGKWLPVENFAKTTRYRIGYYYSCRECERKMAAERAARAKQRKMESTKKI